MKDSIKPGRKEIFEEEREWLEMELTNKASISPFLDRLILIGFTNRTNTGALATALGNTPVDPPITRHIQPFKAIARQLMEQKGVQASTPLTFFKDIIEIGSGTQLIKETIGPNRDNPAEWIDTMKILKAVGLPFEKLIFIPTFRNPFDCVLSWKRMWKWEWKDFPFDSFNLSFQTVSQKIQYALSEGAVVVPYVHEFLRDFDRETVMKSVCEKAGLPYSPNIVQWDNPATNQDDNIDWYFSGNIVKYDQPPDRWVQGALAVTRGGRGGLIWKPIEHGFASKEEREFVMARIQPALEIHNMFSETTKKLLDLI